MPVNMPNVWTSSPSPAVRFRPNRNIIASAPFARPLPAIRRWLRGTKPKVLAEQSSNQKKCYISCSSRAFTSGACAGPRWSSSAWTQAVPDCKAKDMEGLGREVFSNGTANDSGYSLTKKIVAQKRSEKTRAERPRIEYEVNQVL